MVKVLFLFFLGTLGAGTELYHRILTSSSTQLFPSFAQLRCLFSILLILTKNETSQVMNHVFWQKSHREKVCFHCFGKGLTTNMRRLSITFCFALSFQRIFKTPCLHTALLPRPSEHPVLDTNFVFSELWFSISLEITPCKIRLGRKKWKYTFLNNKWAQSVIEKRHQSRLAATTKFFQTSLNLQWFLNLGILV